MASDGSDLIIKNSIFKGNKGKSLGGVFKITENTKSLISNCSFEDNFSDDGSVFYTFDCMKGIFLNNCIFSNNTSNNNMFNIYNSLVYITNSTFKTNMNSSIYNIKSIIIISHLTFIQNICDKKDIGCLIHSEQSTLQLDYVYIYGIPIILNSLGFINVFSTYLTINFSSFYCLYTESRGSGLYAISSSVYLYSIEFSEFYPNSCYLENSELTINFVNFSNLGHVSQIYGSLICSHCLEISIKNSIFNISFGSLQGGALLLIFSQKTELFNCKFINNSAVDGGAIYSIGTNVTISQCLFDSNGMVNRGGAIFIDQYINNSFVISNTIFNHNKALLEGGAIKYTDATPKLNDLDYNDNMCLYGSNIGSYPIRIQFRAYNKSGFLNFFI